MKPVFQPFRQIINRDRRRDSYIKLLKDQLPVLLQGLHIIAITLHIGNQCRNRINITSPELDPGPTCFQRRRSAPTEYINNLPNINTFSPCCSNRLGRNKSRKLRRIGMNPMYSRFHLIPEIPAPGLFCNRIFSHASNSFNNSSASRSSKRKFFISSFVETGGSYL